MAQTGEETATVPATIATMVAPTSSTAQSTVPQQPIYVVVQPNTNLVNNFPKKLGKGLAITQIVLGAIAIISQVSF